METVKVDRERFEAAVKKAGYPSQRDLSREMGYSPQWIYQHLLRGDQIPKIAASYLEVRHGIGYDEYKPVPKKKNHVLTTEEFKVLVKEAVKEAVREILEERRKDGI